MYLHVHLSLVCSMNYYYYYYSQKGYYVSSRTHTISQEVGKTDDVSMEELMKELKNL